jgi:imidazole glycerol-phosphate synthase subunit HisF
MRKVRVIPRLDIKGSNLVKGIHLEGLRVLGPPDVFCQHYYENGADEIFYMDTVASLYERNSLDDIISETAKKTFIPLTVGGGLRTVEDIRRVLKSGADKVCINTAAVKNPDFIYEAARLFGSSTIVVAIEAIKNREGRYFAFIDNGREETGLEVSDWAKKVEDLGAGEIVITSVDRDGTGEGFDRDLIHLVSDQVKIPVIAHGGSSTAEEAAEMARDTHVDAICVASSFHYQLLEGGKICRDFQNEAEGNTRFLNSGSGFRKEKVFDIASLKDAMDAQGVPCRRPHL